MGVKEVTSQTSGTVEMTWMHAHPPCDATTNHADIEIVLSVDAADANGATYSAAVSYLGAETGIGHVAAYEMK